MKFNYKYILFALLILFFFSKLKENFAATSPGTLMQLVASGAQDIYLTGGDGRPAEPVLESISNY